MQDFLTVTGMVLKTIPVGEYDRHVCLLTKERGKITAYARGARRQNNRLMAATNPFCFGEFKLYASRNSYNLSEASISHYFEELRMDVEGAYYGMYFLEMADYYTRENNDDREMLKLLFQSLRALSKDTLPRRLVRYVFEQKAMVVNGEFPGMPQDGRAYQEATAYTVEYVTASSIEKLYTFTLKEEILEEYSAIMDGYRRRYIDRHFNSLDVLKELGM
ncbi:MAG: DNA repair protein RecO [Clostridium sp.]|nr:DNA repair protein RecO [Clostridium sp.]